MINPLIRLSLIALVSLSMPAVSQVTINSPYSRYGIGVMNEPGSVKHFSMGGVVTPIADGSVLNINNPGTYSYLSETVFQVGLRGTSTAITNEAGTSQFRGGGVNEIVLGFKRQSSPWTVVFGLTPYSQTGYRVEDRSPVFDSLSLRRLYTGEGGLNRLTIGAGRVWEAYRDTTSNRAHRISIGLNVNYLFGSVEQSRRVIYNTNQLFHTRASSSVKVGDYFFNAGLHYLLPLAGTVENKRLVKGGFLHIGLDYTLGTAINTRFSELGETFYYFATTEITADTSYFVNNTRGYFTMPSRLSAGVAYFYQNKKGGGITIGADFRMQDWSGVTGSNEIRMITPTALTKYQTLAFGVEFVPEGLDKATRFFRKLSYRAGTRQTDTYLSVQNQMVRQTALSAGICIPLLASRSATKVHLGAEFSNIDGGNLAREHVIMIQVGLSLHPFERWFYQRKYD